MIKLTDALENMKGECVDIYTKHRLFGDQHIQTKFYPETEIGFGFHCKGQVICITDKDYIGYSIGRDMIIIYGNNMNIKIIKRA